MANPVVEYILRLRDEASPALEDTAQAAEKTTDAGDKTSVSFAGLATAGATLAAGLAGATAGFFAFQQSVADARNDLTDMSTRTGVAAETLAGLKLAAEGSGLSLRSVEGVLAQYPKRMADAARGTGEASLALNALFNEAEAMKVAAMETDESLKLLVARIGEVESPSERAALATQVWGRQGTKLLQALGDGKALDKYIQQAKLFGVDVGPEAAKAAADWQRQVAALKNIVSGFADEFGAVFGANGGAAAALETFNFALIYTKTLVSEWVVGTYEQFATLWDSVTLLFEGDFAGSKAAFGRIESDTDVIERASAEAFEAASTFQMLSDATVGVGDVAEATSSTFVNSFTPAVVEAAEAVEELANTYAEDLLAAQQDYGVAVVEWSMTTSEGLREAREGAAALAEEMRAASLSAVQGSIGVAGSLVGGDGLGALAGVSAMAGVAAPIVGAITSGLDMLASLGEQGVGDVIQGLESQARDIVAGFAEVGDLAIGLSDSFDQMLPVLVKQLVAALPSVLWSLVEAAYQLIWSLFVELPFIFTAAVVNGAVSWWESAKPEWWGKPWPEAVDAIKQAMKDWWDSIVDTVRDWFTIGDGKANNTSHEATQFIHNLQSQMGQFADGGYNPRTQLALLHQGERVVQRNGALSGGARRNLALGGGGGGGLSVNITTAVLDNDAIPALVRAIERVYGDYGRGTSPLFGGA